MGFDKLVLCAAEKVAEFLGYEGLKEHQRQIILELMKKRDVVLRDFIGYHNLYTLSTDGCFYLSYFAQVQCPPQAKTKEYRRHFCLTSNVQIYLITFQLHK